MYVPVGGHTLLRTQNIIGIFDTDAATVSKHSRNLLNTAQRENKVITVSESELPRSFVLYAEKGKIYLYLCPVAAATLKKRITENK